jgi:hypothetical protein
MKKYPLSLSTYYLDFSYPGELSLQTRFFINIPFQGKSIVPDEQIKLLEICFDMNSLFNKEGYKSKNNIDLGLTILLGLTAIDLPAKNSKEYFKKKITDGDENFKMNYFFDSEKELYEAFINTVRKFLEEAYDDKWFNFIKQSMDKYEKKSLLFNEKEKEKYFSQQPNKINKFITETIDRLELMLNSSIINEDFFEKYRVSLKQNERSIVNQIMNSVPLEELTHVIELNKISKTYQYYKLSNELPINESNSKPKNKI